MKRDEKRKETRTAARGVIAMLIITASMVIMTGCQSATPSATSNQSDQENCHVTVNNTVNVNIYPAMPVLDTTNAIAKADAPTNSIAKVYNPVVIPSMTFTVSDVMGTQSTSSEGGANSQDMTPTMTPGVTGDKPIAEIGSTVRSGLSAGTTTAVDAAAATIDKATQ